MPLARADLEAILRGRNLDRTLTTALAAPDPQDDRAIAPTGIAALDARLGGGFPRGHLSELVGRRSSGRTSVLLQMLAAAIARGELVALVDALDSFDVASAQTVGIDLDRCLWIRGHVVPNAGLCHDTNQRALDQAVKALTLVLQAGNFGVVAFDAAEAPSSALRRLPFTTWLRLQRIIEGSVTACVLVGNEPMGRSSAGLTVKLGIKNSEFGIRHSELGIRYRGRLFDGLDLEARIVRARYYQASACGPREESESSSAAARASGGGAPRAVINDICVPLSTASA